MGHVTRFRNVWGILIYHSQMDPAKQYFNILWWILLGMYSQTEQKLNTQQEMQDLWICKMGNAPQTYTYPTVRLDDPV